MKSENELPNDKVALIVYILYIVSLCLGLTSIIGLVLAYIYKDDEPDWVKTHYHYQIRTFWISVFFIGMGVLTALFFVGIFVLLFWFVWFLIRNIKGIKYLTRKEAIPNPTAWGC